MQIDDARDDLPEELAGLWLGQPLLLDDVVEQLAAFSVFHDQVQRLGRLYYFIQLDDVGMLD